MEAYKLRMKVEYNQLKTKIDKLDRVVRNAKNGSLGFELNCPLELLEEQLDAMKSYAVALEKRADIEEVAL